MPKEIDTQSQRTVDGHDTASSHWSNVAAGEHFTVTFVESDKIPAHLDRALLIGKEVRLMRDPVSGYTVGCHDGWKYQARVNSDTRYHALTSAACNIKFWGAKKPKTATRSISSFFNNGPSIPRNSMATLPAGRGAGGAAGRDSMTSDAAGKDILPSNTESQFASPD